MKKALKKSIKSYNVLPLKDLVVFPNMVVPLIVGRKKSVEAIESAMRDDKMIFLVAQKDASKESVKTADLYRVGVIARILQLVRLPNGLVKILVEGVSGGEVKRFSSRDKSMRATLQFISESENLDEEDEAKRRQLVALFKQYIKLNEEVPEEILFSFNQLSDLSRISDFIATYMDITVDQKQQILEKNSLRERITFLLNLLRAENQILSIKADLDDKVRNQMVQSQRNYYLQEQLRVIREELGDEEGSNPDYKLLKQRIEESNPSKEALEKAQEELHRFERIPVLSPESGVIRTYLEWICDLPWHKETEDRSDIADVKRILDEDHYGMRKAKERIVEYIATLNRVGHISGSILCLIGPPGVGKTSLGNSIARALNRKYIRISLGGISDEAEIRGHRRTYIGAMPGRIIQGMKRAGTVNPVFLLDEIDKLGSDFRGDPASALLEVLDPEQNRHFVDHYLEVEYDLSKVMFVLTANSTAGIPAALYDRLEILELPGYHDEEKMHIARDYIFRKMLNNHGLTRRDIGISESAIRTIISRYTAEAGVRNLEREINKIGRKSVVELAKDPELKKVSISQKNLIKFLGEPKYTLKPIIRSGEKGVALGLAWTSYGGDVLPIEVNLLSGKDKLVLTGKLGEIMRESAQIAISFLRLRSKRYNIDPNFSQQYEIHVHLPEGAVPKEGPSAGITLTTAILLALLNKAFPKGMAMTGEITLRGKVLAVGGLNEKLLAARRLGIKRILLPAENKKNINEIDKEVYENSELIFVNHYDEIFDLIFDKKKSAS